MKKMLLIPTLVLLMLVAVAAPVMSKPDKWYDDERFEQQGSGGRCTIDVLGNPRVIVTAQHFGWSDFYEGKGDRFSIFVYPATGSPRLVSAYEDNPTRYLFSTQTISPGITQRYLVNRALIQIKRVDQTVTIYWNIPLVAEATTTTPAVTIPPGRIELQGFGDPTTRIEHGAFDSGWNYDSQIKLFSATGTLFLPSWNYEGPVTGASIVTEGTFTWTHP